MFSGAQGQQKVFISCGAGWGEGQPGGGAEAGNPVWPLGALPSTFQAVASTTYAGGSSSSADSCAASCYSAAGAEGGSASGLLLCSPSGDQRSQQQALFCLQAPATAACVPGVCPRLLLSPSSHLAPQQDRAAPGVLCGIMCNLTRKPLSVSTTHMPGIIFGMFLGGLSTPGVVKWGLCSVPGQVPPSFPSSGVMGWGLIASQDPLLTHQEGEHLWRRKVTRDLAKADSILEQVGRAGRWQESVSISYSVRKVLRDNLVGVTPPHFLDGETEALTRGEICPRSSAIFYQNQGQTPSLLTWSRIPLTMLCCLFGRAAGMLPLLGSLPGFTPCAELVPSTSVVLKAS